MPNDQSSQCSAYSPSLPLHGRRALLQPNPAPPRPMLHSAYVNRLACLLCFSAKSFTDNAIQCSELTKIFPSRVVSTSSPLYPTWNHRWADTAELKPSCIFRPQSAEDVSAAVKILAKGAGKSSKDSCPFSLVAGGHTPWAGANNIDVGVALELSELNQVVISDDRSHVKLGAGARWHDAYVKTDGEGLVYPGGRCPDVGVAGKKLP